ncbi:MAG: TRAP transporter large permease [Syntrophales bacterium]|nr:TRAP transporter large permease [Syntrophales bacterium]
MELWLISILCLLLMIILVFSGLHVAYSLLLSGMLGILFIGGLQMLGAQLGSIGYNATASYGYVVIPMFILMGQFAAEGGLGNEAYRAARLWVGKLYGGLAMATIAGCGIFGAASGSTASASALFAKVAFPEMVKYGYHRGLAAGCIAASGTVASMIPPSILLVLFGIIAEQPIGKLLVAGIGPGMLEIFSYMFVVYLAVRINPKLAPIVTDEISWKDRFGSLKDLMPIAVVFMFAIGGIFFGVFTPSEGGAMGASGALIVVLLMRRLSFQGFKKSLRESGIITGMMFLAIIGGFLFARMLVLGGIVEAVTNFIITLPLSRHLIFLGITLLYLILGMVMQPIVIMLITIPILLPAISSMGYDPIWFGIIFVRLAELAVITPPVSVNLYVVKGILGDEVSLGDIFKGTFLFIMADISNVFLLYLFPQIALWLPGVMWK